MFIETKVKGKQRPRFRRVGNYVQTYTPKETQALEKMIAAKYKAEGGKLYEGTVEVVIAACFRPAKSLSKKKQYELMNHLYCDKKPDIDNIAKLVLDALNGVAYTDDKNVVSLKVVKLYEDTEGIEVNVYEADI